MMLLVSFQVFTAVKQDGLYVVVEDPYFDSIQLGIYYLLDYLVTVK
jgi:hypothetical protein